MSPNALSPALKERLASHPLYIIGLLIAVYCISMGLMVTFIHTCYLSTHDLGIFTQSFWSTVHENSFFTNSIDSVSHCSFGAHNSLILIALLPIYFIFQYPLVFPLVSTILLGIAAVPLFFIARALYSERFAYILVIIYLLSPVIHGINLYNFSTICFVPLLFFLSWYGLLMKRWRLYLIAGLCLIIVREDVALLAVMIGVYGFFFSGNNSGKFRICHLILMIIGVLYALISMMVIIPFFSLAPSLSSQYSELLFGNFTLYGSQRIALFVKIFAPLLFLPFAAPEVLLVGIFQILEVFLSPFYPFLDLQYHYSGMFEPAVILATLYGLKRISDRVQGGRWGKIVPWLEYALLFSSILGFIFISAFITYLSVMPDYQDQSSTEKFQVLDSIIEKIPAEAVLVTQDNIIPHVSERKGVYLYGYHPDADYVVLETGTGYANPFKSDIELYKNWTLLIKKDEIVVFSNPQKPNLQVYLSGL